MPYFSYLIVYFDQLLYVYISRTESGGRLFNVAANRVIACAVFMQLIMILSESKETGRRRHPQIDTTHRQPLALTEGGTPTSLPRPLRYSYSPPSRSLCADPWRSNFVTTLHLPKRPRLNGSTLLKRSARTTQRWRNGSCTPL